MGANWGVFWIGGKGSFKGNKIEQRDVQRELEWRLGAKGESQFTSGLR